MNTTVPLAIDVRLDGSYEEALERVADALKEQGFGILTRIDVKETLKTKLDVDFRDYAILGACNPKLAHRALSARPEIGLMLPCNVTVEATGGGGVLVRIADPRVMMGVGGFENDPEIAAVASEARALLAQAAVQLSTSSSTREG
ncbi:MAG: DUF302 domain-containing protein [Gemmatimonadota bacterium]|nr:DUF302 domain-containing protein [Gemmatimonadota bacterium]MDH3422833.1 DUF302 domain-containing protein [Gemmatimonadota bacterium]